MKSEESYWEQLAERYFQAETSEAEEQQLRRFLCSSQAQDSRFDEIRATMSLLYVCRKASPDSSRGVNKTSSPWERAGERLRIIAVAACLCVAMFLGWRQYQQHNISSVRIAGEDVEADASLLMQQQMAEMFNPIDQSNR
ncbi:MAG: hypothetical protein IK144_09510 [Bacteroidaceae bacterium]|nr:hypothetical protein [Bacteroidaceae bacterium]